MFLEEPAAALLRIWQCYPSLLYHISGFPPLQIWADLKNLKLTFERVQLPVSLLSFWKAPWHLAVAAGYRGSLTQDCTFQSSSLCYSILNICMLKKKNNHQNKKNQPTKHTYGVKSDFHHHSGVWAECLPSQNMRHFTATLCRNSTRHLLTQGTNISWSLIGPPKETPSRVWTGQEASERKRMLLWPGHRTEWHVWDWPLAGTTCYTKSLEIKSCMLWFWRRNQSWEQLDQNLQVYQDRDLRLRKTILKHYPHRPHELSPAHFH